MGDFILAAALFAVLLTGALIFEMISDRRYDAWFRSLSLEEKDAYCAWLRLHAGVIRRSPAGLGAMYRRERAAIALSGDAEGEE